VRGVTDARFTIEVEAEDSSNNALGDQTQVITLDGSLQRVKITYENLPASTDHIQLIVWSDQINNGDSLDVRFGAVNIEKSSYATSYMSGDLDHCSWDGTAHQSQTSRTVTNVNLDSHVDLIEDNDTTSWAFWWQPRNDYDDNWPSPAALSEIALSTNNNRIAFFYNLSGANKIVARIGKADTTLDVESSALSFAAGDWIHVALTVDWTGNAKLYINGVLEDTTDISSLVSSPVGYDGWQIGATDTGTLQSASAYGEYAVFDSVLTAEEVSALYQRGEPLVDVGAFDTPGAYILDGRFSLATSTSGARTEIDSSGWWAYDADGNEAFGLSLEDSVSWGGFTMDKADIVLGDNVSGSAAIRWDQSTGKFGFYGDGSSTVQVEIGTDGILYAGGGSVGLGADGITIREGNDGQDHIKWVTSSEHVLFYLTGYYDGSSDYYNYILGQSDDNDKVVTQYLWVQDNYNNDTYIRLKSGDRTTDGEIFFYVNNGPVMTLQRYAVILESGIKLYFGGGTTYGLRLNGTHIEWYNGSSWVQLD